MIDERIGQFSQFQLFALVTYNRMTLERIKYAFEVCSAFAKHFDLISMTLMQLFIDESVPIGSRSVWIEFDDESCSLRVVGPLDLRFTQVGTIFVCKTRRFI